MGFQQGLEFHLVAQGAGVLGARFGRDPGSEERGQRGLGEDAERAWAAHDEGHPRHGAAAALDGDRVPPAGRNGVQPPGLMEDGFLVWRRAGRDRLSIDASCSGGAIKHRDGHALTVIDF